MSDFDSCAPCTNCGLCGKESPDPELLTGTCWDCGGLTYIIRPGHYQCDYCSDNFCHTCGWSHRGIVEDCGEFQALLEKHDYDFKLLLQLLREG